MILITYSMAKNKHGLLQRQRLMNSFWNTPPTFSELLSDFVGGVSFRGNPRPLFFTHNASTACDIEDLGKEILVKVDLPGVMKKDIKLDISENSVEISAEHKDESSKKRKNFLKKERTELSYYRVLPLPVKVLSGKAKAKLADGILSVTIPKANPTKRKKNSISVE